MKEITKQSIGCHASEHNSSR